VLDNYISLLVLFWSRDIIANNVILKGTISKRLCILLFFFL